MNCGNKSLFVLQIIGFKVKEHETNPSFEMMMVTSTVEQFSLWNFKFQHQKLVRPLYENE